MATVIEQAIKCKRKAMTQLYEANKKKVYYVSYLLLGKEAGAAEATTYAFRDVWGSLAVRGVQTEDEFLHLVTKKAVDYCKRRILKKDPKAFHIPHNRNFLIVGTKEFSESSENVSLEILKELPSLQRFIMVLHTVAEYLPEQVAETFKFNMQTVSIALDAEKTNVERIMRCMGENKNTYEWLFSKLRDGKEEINVPESIDKSVLLVIDNRAKPIEKKQKKMMTIIGIGAVVACLLIIGIVALATRDASTTYTDGDDASISDTSTDDTADTSLISEPVIELDETLTYYADIEIADYGTITVELDQDAAPVTVSNFVNLAQNGFYDGLTFHRIIEDFMMQGGDPNGDGTGGDTDDEGNEINIVGEFTDNGYENSLSHTRGAISMARSSDYNSASSQFFIVHEDSSSSLDGQYAVFGYVTEGLEIVDAVCEVAEPTDDNGTIESDAQPVITSITIRTE